MQYSAARAHMTIGEVLGLLSAEFPDITVSKIRFLEAEGLIEPERSPSGYRKFAPPTRSGCGSSWPPSATTTFRCGSSRSISTRSTAARPLRRWPAGTAVRPRGLVATDSVFEDAGDVRLTRRQLLDPPGWIRRSSPSWRSSAS